MYPNPQYDYDYGPDGPLAPLQERAEYPDQPVQISPPIGWVDLVLDLNAELSNLIPDYTVAQVKEKFGELRYYIGSYGIPRDDPRMDLVRELIAEAEDHSMRICQVCGESARFRNNHAWHATLCDEHAS